MKRNKILIFSLIGCGVLIGLQFIKPHIINNPITGDLQAPKDVKQILKRACYDCHSNETKLSWFDKISPISWRVASHVKDRRAGLNFSEWDKLTSGARKAKLLETVNQIIAGAMPLNDYQIVDPESKITQKDFSILKKYVSGMTDKQPIDTGSISTTYIKKEISDKPAVSISSNCKQ
ncbi:hypothetical protein ABIB40_000196 [Pedobacter sp. UYP30]